MSDEPIRFVCIDADAMPLFGKSHGGVREVKASGGGRAVAESLNRPLEWVFKPWVEMMNAVDAGEGEAVWCGQTITAERRERADFTRPYAVFDESLLVRVGSAMQLPGTLAGTSASARSPGSTNMALAETFEGAELVPFGGESEDVFGEMIDALRAGEVDGVVDDDVAFLALVEDPDFEIAFDVGLDAQRMGHRRVEGSARAARPARQSAPRGHRGRPPRALLEELVAGAQLPLRRSGRS